MDGPNEKAPSGGAQRGLGKVKRTSQVYAELTKPASGFEGGDR